MIIRPPTGRFIAQGDGFKKKSSGFHRSFFVVQKGENALVGDGDIDLHILQRIAHTGANKAEFAVGLPPAVAAGSHPVAAREPFAVAEEPHPPARHLLGALRPVRSIAVRRVSFALAGMT